MGAQHRFTQADVTRAVRGAVKAGMRVGQFKIDPNGAIVVMSENVAPAVDPNPWDQAVGIRP